MCQRLPGDRCANETCPERDAACKEYRSKHADGPDIDPQVRALATAAHPLLAGGDTGVVPTGKSALVPVRKKIKRLEDYGLAPGTRLRENLDPDEIDEMIFEASIWAYSLDIDELEAISDYTANAHMDINSHLKMGTADRLSPAMRRAMGGLDSALAKAWPVERTVYRGARVPEHWTFERAVARLEAAFPAGTSVAFPTFLSTSMQPSVATGFGRGPRPVVFEMRAAHGALVEGLTEMPGEVEVIIGRDSTWRVAGITPDARTTVADIDDYKETSVIMVHMVADELVAGPAPERAPGLPPLREMQSEPARA